MYNPINSPLPNVSELCQSLSHIDKTCLLLSVIDLESAPVIVNTKFGKFQKGSPVAVQQKLYNHYVLNILDAPEYPSLPVVNFMKNTVCTVLDEKKSLALNSVIVTSEDSIHIEEMTRLQTNEPKWHKLRKDRLTASVAGDIVKRKADNEPLVARLKTTRKVVTESMCHGLSFESVAAAAFVKLHDDNVNVYPCGIIVSPYSPWLAASPDRKVYHPSRIPQFGLFEIKCPVKALSECMYLTGSIEERKLKQNHNYFYQVMMQLAVTGLKWCYFYVWRLEEYHEEIIEFDEDVWDKMKHKLDLFYFNHFIE